MKLDCSSKACTKTPLVGKEEKTTPGSKCSKKRVALYLLSSSQNMPYVDRSIEKAAISC